MIGLITVDRYFPAFMQHLHAGYTPEDSVFHAELDTNAELVEDTPGPKVVPKPQHKATESGVGDKALKRIRKHARKKPPGKTSGQGELPI
jgi:hypothetical protein